MQKRILLIIFLLSSCYKGSLGCALDDAPPGSYINTTTCEYVLAPTGTYSPGGNITAPISCDAGKYQDEEGRTSCKPCSSGKYQDQTGQTFCNNCEEGSYQPGEGEISCILCDEGTSTTGEGAISCDVCILDDAPPGSYINTTICEYVLAPTGTYSPGGNITAPISCDAGEYQDEEGRTSCKPCSPGKYQDQTGQTFCNNCEEGSYQPGEGETSCILCNEGTSTTGEGAISCDVCILDDAPPGSYINTTTCEYELAPTGTYSPGGNITAPISCDAGKYQDEEGQTSCQACSAGQYQDQTGQTFCNNCEEGSYQPGEGETSCILCDEGTSTTGEGAISCDDACPDDENKNSPGICGCGVEDTDADGDGIADCETAAITTVNSSSSGNEAVNIYPNPTSGVVKFELGSVNTVSIRVFNLIGELVHEDAAFNTSSYQFELKGESGVYIMEITFKGKLTKTILIKN